MTPPKKTDLKKHKKGSFIFFYKLLIWNDFPKKMNDPFFSLPSWEGEEGRALNSVADFQHYLAARVAALDVAVRVGYFFQRIDRIQRDLHRAVVDQPRDLP